ncbi:MAG: cysteine hydrolase family protein [Gallionella sp.]
MIEPGALPSPLTGTALLVIDMQVGLFGADTPRHDAEGVVDRINALARAVRREGGAVIFIQHDGPPGDVFEPGREGWKILPSLEREEGDPVVHKSACDAFYQTDLAEMLQKHGATRLIVTGCATDFCVDTTVRAAASRDYVVVVAEDGHTTADRPHVDAVSVIRHHNWLWQNLIHPRTRILVIPAVAVVALIESEPRATDGVTR